MTERQLGIGGEHPNQHGVLPTNSVSADNLSLINRIAEAVEASHGGFHTLNQHMLRNMLRGTLSMHSVDDLMRIDDALATPSALSNGVAKQLMQNVSAEEVSSSIRGYPILGVEDYLQSSALFKSVRHYWQLPELEHFFTAPIESQSKGVALMKVTNAILEERRNGNLENPKIEDDKILRFLYRTGDFKTFRILDGDLINLILENYTRVDEIVSIIHTQLTTDTRIIRAILDGIAPALATGAL